METVLYDISKESLLNPDTLRSTFIFVIVGMSFLGYGLSKIRSLKKERNRFTIKEITSSNFFGAMAAIIGTLVFLFGVVNCFLGVNEQLKCRKMLMNDEVDVVEGYVEKYHAMPAEGHDTEHFEINGIIFNYSDYVIVNGYHKTASHGGVVTHNGQHIKIKYITKDLSVTGNTDNYDPNGKTEYEDDLPYGYNIIVNENGDWVQRQYIIVYIAEIND